MSPTTVAILGAPLVEQLLTGAGQGRKLQQAGPLAYQRGCCPPAAARSQLAAHWAQRCLAGVLHLVPEAPLPVLRPAVPQAEPLAPTAAAILGAPLAEQLLTGPAGQGRKLQQAGLAALLPVPVAESLVESARLAEQIGTNTRPTGRKLQQV